MKPARQMTELPEENIKLMISFSQELWSSNVFGFTIAVLIFFHFANLIPFALILLEITKAG